MVVSEVLSFVKKTLDKDTILLMKTGSNLNGLVTEKTKDDDYIAIVKDNKFDILSGKKYSKQIQTDGLDIKVYDVRKCFELIEKANFNFIESFNVKPVYFDCNCKLFKCFDDMKTFRLNAINYDTNNLLRSMYGYTLGRLKQIKRGKNITAKDLIDIAKINKYLDSISNNDFWEVDFAHFLLELYDFNKDVNFYVFLKDLKLMSNNQIDNLQKSFEIYAQETLNKIVQLDHTMIHYNNEKLEQNKQLQNVFLKQIEQEISEEVIVNEI